VTVEVTEEQRQALILAAAELSLSRPGWYAFLRETADAFNGGVLFELIRVTNAHRIPPAKETSQDGSFPI